MFTFILIILAFLTSKLSATEFIGLFSQSKFLKESNFWIYGFESSAKKNFSEVKWSGNNVLLFGSEGFGMRKHTVKYTDFLLKIDINTKIESLNISNSAAIVFHHLNYLKKNVD